MAVFQVLLHHFETLATRESPLEVATALRLSVLRAGIEAAQRQDKLDLLEDEIDAYFQAHIGLYRLRWGDERSAVLGTVTDG